MKAIPYVAPKAAWFAADIEALFANLPASHGVCFTSVQALPAENGDSSGIHVILGLKKSLNYDIGAALIKQVVQEEINRRGITTPLYVEMSVYVGSAGKFLGKYSEAAHPTEKT